MFAYRICLGGFVAGHLLVLLGGLPMVSGSNGSFFSAQQFELLSSSTICSRLHSSLQNAASLVGKKFEGNTKYSLVSQADPNRCKEASDSGYLYMQPFTVFLRITTPKAMNFVRNHVLNSLLFF